MAPFKDPEELFDKRREEARHGNRGGGGGEKLSWRELDRRREGGSSVDSAKPRDDRSDHPRNRWKNAQAEKTQKSVLDALFADNAGDALRKAVIDSADRVSLQEALDAYVADRGSFPPDPEFLARALDTRKDRVLRDVVTAVAEALPEAGEEQRKVLLLKMRSKARSTFDAKAARQMKALIAEYGVDPS